MRIPRFHRRLKVRYFNERWQDLQAYCSSRKTWPKAITEADKLLDKALKQRNFKGKSTGERLVAAQRELSFNEAVWFSHKFSKKLTEDKIDVRKLKKKDVAMALAGFREALRDLGALEQTKKKEKRNDVKS
jgi:hypothetical protein